MSYLADITKKATPHDAALLYGCNFLKNYLIMTNLSISNEENNFYHESHTVSTILVSSDLMPDFEIPLGGFEYFLWKIEKIGEWYDEYNRETIRVDMKDFWESEQGEIDELLSEYIKGEWIPAQQPQEVEMPNFDTYELIEGEQRPTYEEERYMKYIM